MKLFLHSIFKCRFDFTFGFLQLLGVAVAVLYAAACQNNGAAYILAFSLFGLFCVGSLQALRNLSGLSVRAIGTSHGYAPSEFDVSCGVLEVRLALHNESAKTRYALSFSLPQYSARTSEGIVSVLIPNSMREAVIRVAGLSRGCHRISLIDIASVYPFGFSRIVRRFAIRDCEAWVYPAPVRGDQMPSGDSPVSGSGGGGGGGDDFIGVRNYQEGESQRHVDWKAVSRGNSMMVKQFGGGVERAVVLDWDRLDGDAEARLSSLCFWLLEVEREGFRYGLRIPGVETPHGNGPDHLHALLRHLAAFPNQSFREIAREPTLAPSIFHSFFKS